MAPIPVRPALRDQSALTQAKRTRFSPPTPIAATLTWCVPSRALISPSASRQAFPLSSGIGTMVASSSSMNRNDSSFALPVIDRASIPVCRSSIPKLPPIEESP